MHLYNVDVNHISKAIILFASLNENYLIHFYEVIQVCINIRGGGDWPRKVVWGYAALKIPFSRLSCSLQGSHFKQKKSVHKTPFWGNLEIFASTASIFAQILALKPPNLEIFSSQAPPLFRGIYQFASPTLQKSGHTPLPKKKLSASPRVNITWKQH